MDVKYILSPIVNELLEAQINKNYLNFDDFWSNHWSRKIVNSNDDQ